MVNKPCSRACSKTAKVKLPTNYRSRSAGSLPNRRSVRDRSYAQYLFGDREIDEEEFVKELQRPAVIQVFLLIYSLILAFLRQICTKWIDESGYKKYSSIKSSVPNSKMPFDKIESENIRIQTFRFHPQRL